jgi:catechol 2,3-dioxygenase-like lactoylglutathione lyase family enzyme
MTRGSISHIALTVSDLERSTAFYNKVFEFIGFRTVEVPESTQQAMKTRLKAWVGPGYSISSVHRRASLRAGYTIETLLDLTIWRSLQRTDQRLTKCTSS